MGKKRILKKTEEELIKEADAQAKVFVKKGAGAVSEKKITPVSLKEGRIYISASYNNTIITLTDAAGDVLGQTSAGSIGFKGSKKSTPYAASKVAEVLAEKCKKIGIMKVRVLVKGIGSGRDSAIRSLANHGLNIFSIKDITPLPHGGTKPPKVRRV